MATDHVPISVLFAEAVEIGDIGAVRQLISRGAKVNEVVEDEESRDVTPLMIAAKYGRYEIARLLIERRAEVNARDHHVLNIQGARRTPLHYAAEKGNIQLVRLLLTNGARIDVVDTSGNTPLTKAVFSGNMAVVNALIENGASVNVKRKAPHFTPLTMAIRQHHFEIAERLIEAGANVNACEGGGDTALMCAAHANSSRMVRVLIRAGADINARTKGGFSALMCACTLGGTKPDATLVKLLLRAGAHVTGASRIATRSINLTNSTSQKAAFRKIIKIVNDRKRCLN